jgi:hypothetical protein
VQRGYWTQVDWRVIGSYTLYGRADRRRRDYDFFGDQRTTADSFQVGLRTHDLLATGIALDLSAGLIDDYAADVQLIRSSMTRALGDAVYVTLDVGQQRSRYDLIDATETLRLYGGSIRIAPWSDWELTVSAERRQADESSTMLLAQIVYRFASPRPASRPAELRLDPNPDAPQQLGR